MQSLCESSAHNKSRQRSPNQKNFCPQNKISPKQSSATSTIHGIIIFPKTNTLCPLVPKRELPCIIIYHVVGLYQLERQVCSSMILKKVPDNMFQYLLHPPLNKEKSSFLWQQNLSSATTAAAALRRKTTVCQPTNFECSVAT